jgi:hypothetical protein
LSLAGQGGVRWWLKLLLNFNLKYFEEGGTEGKGAPWADGVRGVGATLARVPLDSALK